MDSCQPAMYIESERNKFLNIDNLSIIRNKLDLVLIEGLYDLINRNLSAPLPTNGENLHFAIEMSAMF